MKIYNELQTYINVTAGHCSQTLVLAPIVFSNEVQLMFMDSLTALSKKLNNFPKPPQPPQPKPPQMCIPTELKQLFEHEHEHNENVWYRSFKEFSLLLLQFFELVQPFATIVKFFKMDTLNYVTPVSLPPFRLLGPHLTIEEKRKRELTHTSNISDVRSHLYGVMSMSTRIPMLLMQLTNDINTLVCTLANVNPLEDVSVKASRKREVKAWLLQVTKLHNAAKAWLKKINDCKCDELLKLDALASACATKTPGKSEECTDECAPLNTTDLAAVCNANNIQEKIKQIQEKIKPPHITTFFQTLFKQKPKPNNSKNTLGGGQLKLSSQTLARRKRTAARKRESTRKRESQRKLTAARKRESQWKLTAQEMRTATLTKQSQKHRSEFRPRSRSHRSDFRPRSRSHRSEFRPRSRSHRSDFRRRSRLHRSELRPRSRSHRSDFRPRSRSHRSDFRAR